MRVDGASSGPGLSQRVADIFVVNEGSPAMVMALLLGARQLCQALKRHGATTP